MLANNASRPLSVHINTTRPGGVLFQSWAIVADVVPALKQRSAGSGWGSRPIQTGGFIAVAVKQQSDLIGKDIVGTGVWWTSQVYSPPGTPVCRDKCPSREISYGQTKCIHFVLVVKEEWLSPGRLWPCDPTRMPGFPDPGPTSAGQFPSLPYCPDTFTSPRAAPLSPFLDISIKPIVAQSSDSVWMSSKRGPCKSVWSMLRNCLW